MQKSKFLLACAVLILTIFLKCDGSISNNDNISITLTANKAFELGSTSPDDIIVNWGCVVLSANKTGCIYYFNGSAQLDEKMDPSAILYAPGNAQQGIALVALDTVFSDLDAGAHNYTLFLSARGTTEEIEISGALDLYIDAKSSDDNNNSEAGVSDNVNWIITFDTSGNAPSISR